MVDLSKFSELPFDIDSVISYSTLQDEEKAKTICIEDDIKWRSVSNIRLDQGFPRIIAAAVEKFLSELVFDHWCWNIRLEYIYQKQRNVHFSMEVAEIGQGPIPSDADYDDLSDNNLIIWIHTLATLYPLSLIKIAGAAKTLHLLSTFVKPAFVRDNIDQFHYLRRLFCLLAFFDCTVDNPQTLSDLFMIFNPRGLLDQRILVVDHLFDKLEGSIKFAQNRIILLRIFKADGNLLEICDAIQKASPDGSIYTKKLLIICAANERCCLYLNSQDAWFKFLATLDSYFSGTKTFPFQDYTRYHERSQQINEMKLSASIVLESYIFNLISFNESLNNLYSGTNTKMLKTQGKDHMKALVYAEEDKYQLVNRKIEKKEKRPYQKRSPRWKAIQNPIHQALIELSKQKRENQLKREGKKYI